MKPDSQPQRRSQPAQPRRRPPSSAAAILSGKASRRSSENSLEDYLSPSWLLLWFTLLVFSLVAFLFTPYTHQLDEIKNVFLMIGPPGLLIWALWKYDFSTLTWKTHGSTMLLGLYAVSMVFSFLINPYKAIGERVIWFFAGCATFTVVFAWYLDTENKFRKTMIYFVLLGLFSALLGLFLFASQYTEFIYEYMKNSTYWQTPGRYPWMTLFYTLMSSKAMYSFILNEDFYAAFLVMTLFMTLSMFFVEQRKRYKALAVSAFFLMFICLVLTNSNDTYLAFVPAIALYVILSFKYVKEWNLSRRFVMWFLICCACIAISLVLLTLPTILRTWEFKSEAFEGRRVLWGGGFWPWLYGDDRLRTQIDPISVIFGTGPGGYRHYFPWFRRPDFFDQQINNVTTFSHNWYLDVLLETGLVGLVLFTGFMVRIFSDGFRQIRTTASRTHLLYQIAILSGLTGIAVQNFSSPNNRWAVAAMMYWSLFGLSMGLHHLEHPAARPAGTPLITVGGLKLPKMAQWAALLFAVAFAIRCIGIPFIPELRGQGFNYWAAATANSQGVRFMDTADTRSVTSEQKILLDRSRQLFENAIEANPTFATSYYKLGHVYNQLGTRYGMPEMKEKAIETYEALQALHPSYSELCLNLGIMYAQKADDILQNAADMREEAGLKLAQEKTAGPSQKEALRDEYSQLIEKAATYEAKAPELKLRFTEMAYDSMKEAAHQSLKPNVQMLAGSFGEALANLYETAGENEKAAALKEEIKSYYRSIVTYKPKLAEVQKDQTVNYPNALKKLLGLAFETNNLDEAVETLKQQVQDNPDNPQYLMLLLQTYDKQGKPKEKLAFLEDAVHDQPTDAELHRALAEAYKNAGEHKKYELELRKLEVLQPQDGRVLLELFNHFNKPATESKAADYRAKLAAIGVNPDPETTATASGATQTTATTSNSEQLTTPVSAATPVASARAATAPITRTISTSAPKIISSTTIPLTASPNGTTPTLKVP